MAQVQIGSSIDGESAGDSLGKSVSLSADGSIVAIGSYRGFANGKKYGFFGTYKYSNGNWNQMGGDVKGEAEDDELGYSIDISNNGTIVVVGASANDGDNGVDSGHIRLYDLSNVLTSDSFVSDNFSIYPNPTNDIITVDVQNNLQIQKVNVYNTIGALLYSTNQNTVSLKSLAAGIYYVEVLTAQGKATKKVIKQ